MTDGRTDGRTDGGDCNIPNAFLKKRGDNYYSLHQAFRKSENLSVFPSGDKILNDIFW